MKNTIFAQKKYIPSLEEHRRSFLFSTLKSLTEILGNEAYQVQREITSLKLCRILRVSTEAEMNICRILTLRIVDKGEFVQLEGNTGDSFYVCALSHV